MPVDGRPPAVRAVGHSRYSKRLCAAGQGQNFSYRFGRAGNATTMKACIQILLMLGKQGGSWGIPPLSHAAKIMQVRRRLGNGGGGQGREQGGRREEIS